jgi:hypothetical protein
MFNVRKNLVSLDVHYLGSDLRIKRALDDKSDPKILSEIIRSLKILGMLVLKECKDELPETVLMNYFMKMGFTVATIEPEQIKKEQALKLGSYW